MSDYSVDQVCVVVPVFNESPALGPVLDELLAVFPHVVCVDDGSSDDSSSVARSRGARTLRHAINLGAGAATQTGIRAALDDPSFTHIITFDADGQHDVDDAVVMWRKACDDRLDVVLGTRFADDVTSAMPAGRRALLRMATRYTRATTGLAVTDTHVGLRVFSRTAALGLNIRLPGMAHASEVLSYVARSGLPYGEVPVNVRYTPYSLRKGQRNLNAINIAIDLLMARLYALT